MFLQYFDLVTILPLGFALVCVLNPVVEKLLNRKADPGKLAYGATSLGVLLTFLGIWQGLQGFDVADTDASIPILLEGLKLAFGSSISGLFTSLFIKNELIYSLARNSGASGMVLGQALDIKAETSKTKITIEKITNLQSYKTGKLISWSCEVGAILSNEDRSPFKKFASCIGLAFQIQDDILDIIGTSQSLGKKAGKDKYQNKATYISKLGLDGAVKKNKRLVEEACEALSLFGKKAENLRQISHFIINRKN